MKEEKKLPPITDSRINEVSSERGTGHISTHSRASVGQTLKVSKKVKLRNTGMAKSISPNRILDKAIRAIKCQKESLNDVIKRRLKGR